MFKNKTNRMEKSINSFAFKIRRIYFQSTKELLEWEHFYSSELFCTRNFSANAVNFKSKVKFDAICSDCATHFKIV